MEERTVYILWTVGLLWGASASVFVAILWARIKGTEVFLHETLKAFRTDMEAWEAKVPESRLQGLENTITSLRTRIDTAALENNVYREQVHKSMQRFDQIMRRNERALITKAEKQLTEDGVDDSPDEIPLGDVRPPNHQGARRPTRAELREQLRAKANRR